MTLSAAKYAGRPAVPEIGRLNDKTHLLLVNEGSIIGLRYDVLLIFPDEHDSTLQSIQWFFKIPNNSREHLSVFYSLKGWLSENYGEGETFNTWHDDLLKDNIAMAITTGSLDFGHTWQVREGELLYLSTKGSGISLENNEPTGMRTKISIYGSDYIRLTKD